MFFSPELLVQYKEVLCKLYLPVGRTDSQCVIVIDSLSGRWPDLDCNFVTSFCTLQ